MIKRYLQFIKESHENFIIESITENDIDDVLEICAKVFGDVDSAEDVKSYLGEATNWNISKKAVINNKIIGCYLFNEDSIVDFLDGKDCVLENLSKYTSKKGIEGLGLALLPEYRNMGIGKEMRNIPLDMDYDYVWGQHLKGLHNIDNWTKFGRRIVADGDIDGEEMYVTLMDLN